MGSGIFLIMGPITLAIGIALARLSWLGFTDAGIPFTQSRRLRGRVGEVVGEAVLLTATGMIGGGLTLLGTFFLVEHQKSEMLSRARADQANQFVSEVRNRWNALSQSERIEIARVVAGRMGAGHSEEGVLELPDYRTAKECSDEMQRRENERQEQAQRQAFKELQERQETALREQNKQLAENARVLKNGERDLAQLRSRLAAATPGTRDRRVAIAAFVELCERMSNALYQSDDKKRAVVFCREGYEVLTRAIEEEPSNQSYKRRLTEYGYSCIGEVGGADSKDTVRLFEGAVKAARELADATHDPSDYAQAAGLIHNLTNNKEYSPATELIEGYREAVRYERLALIDAPNETHMRDNMRTHLSMLTELLARSKDWKSLLGLSHKLQEPSNPYLLLYAAECCSAACSGARKELKSVALSGGGGKHAIELESCISDATSEGIAFLRQAVVAGLGRAQLDESRDALAGLSSSSDFQALVATVKRLQTQATKPPRAEWNDERAERLHYAALKGNLDEVKSLSDGGCPPALAADALKQAVDGVHSAERLAHKFDDIDLKKAVDGGHAVVQFFLERGADAGPALVEAARFGDLKLAEMMLAAGADPNATNTDGTTPLMAGCSHDEDPLNVQDHQSDFKAVRQLLFKAGANVDAQDKYGFAPLHYAIHGNAFETAKLLVRDRLVRPSKVHATALHAAVNEHSPEITKMLLDAGWNPNVVDRWGSAPLHYAVGKELRQRVGRPTDLTDDRSEEQQSIDAKLRDATAKLSTIISLLIKAGADPTIQDKDGKTPLQIAEKEGFKPLIEEIKKSMPKK